MKLIMRLVSQTLLLKMHIALKEAAETEYWIILLEQSGYIDTNKSDIKNKCLSLKRILISSLNTCKGKI